MACFVRHQMAKAVCHHTAAQVFYFNAISKTYNFDQKYEIGSSNAQAADEQLGLKKGNPNPLYFINSKAAEKERLLSDTCK